MKTLIILALTFSTFAFGSSTLTLSDFSAMNVEQRAQVIEAYKDFLREYSRKINHGEFASSRFSFFAEAIASGNFDCFYAGWPSQTAPANGKRLCTSPMRGNPDYAKLSSSCGANTLLCQPAIFGSGLCVSVATQKLRNSAFAQCENKFREKGRTTADVIRELSPPDKRADLDELISTGQSICATGLQKGTAMCSRLVNKLIAIKNALPPQTQTQAADATRSEPVPPSQPGARVESDSAPQAENRTLETAARAAVSVTSGKVEPTPVDCDPDKPGIQTEPPRNAQVEVRRTEARVPPALDQFERRTCPRPEIQTTRPRAEMLSYLAANNIHIVKGNPEDKHLERFIQDFEKFPLSLRQEMAAKGSRINLIVGQGVSEDPSWAAEARNSNGNDADWRDTTDGRSWSTVSGSGGSLGRVKTPTRIVVNRTYDTSFTNIFLHEYGHTMDNMYGQYSITNSHQWKDTIARDPNVLPILQKLCGENYCANPQHPEESFAELFAYYHGCAESRAHMTSMMPNVARFFERMTNVNALLMGRIPLNPRTPAANR